MQYLGGKSRIAKHIAPFLACSALYEPFVGAFNIVPAVRPKIAMCSDAHPGLIRLYQAVQAGWEPPDTITEVEYDRLRAARDDSPLGVFASFAASFGGKEWGGYARDATGRRDLAAEGAVAFRKKIPFIRAAHFRPLDFAELRPAPGATVYCDPPYKDTTKYRTAAFDHEGFVSWCNQLAGWGCRVFVSEFQNPCPDRWLPVWTRVRKTSVAKSGPVKTEMLLEVQR